MKNNKQLMPLFLIIVFSLIVANVVTAQTIRPIKSVNIADKKIAITFDDGPLSGITEQFLTLFEQEGVKATFFNIGNNLNAHIELARQVLEQDHEIGNHTISHLDLSVETDTAKVENEILNFQAICQTNFEYTPVLFRSPFLKTSRIMSDVLLSNNFSLIDMSISTNDWYDYVDPAEIVNTVTSRIRPGSIILCHEKQHTIDAWAILIPQLKQEGWEFVTVSELLNTLSSVTGQNSMPSTFSLSQNYPNPFNPSTVIEYKLDRPTHVNLSVFDATGRLVQNLVNQNQLPDQYKSVFDASQLSSGLYYYRLETGQHKVTRKMILMH